jgi:hypothetical protein
MPDLKRQTIDRARNDVALFAELLVGQPLWPHQAEVLSSPARTRAMLCGRQSGKSRALAIAALHEAFGAGDRLVLVVSAGESAARRLLSEPATLASAPLLRGSVLDESKSALTLSNGSRVVSVPASERQIRGFAVDLLIVDEACFCDDAVLTAAQFTTVARSGRMLLASTPWGRRDRWFARMFQAGFAGSDGFASWQWPSTASPMVSEGLLAEWRPGMSERAYRAEVLGEWVDDQGSFFSVAELDALAEDFEPIAPADATGEQGVAAGIDWGYSFDSSALVLLGRDPDDGRLFVPWVVERTGARVHGFRGRGMRCG